MNNKINQGAMLPVGSILRGIYRIEGYLSSGGFGNTYVATHVEFEETVAVKEFFMRGVTEREANNTTVSVSNSDNRLLFQEQLQKFKKEARRLWRLKNPHIVSVHDLFEENGTAYYVMDYIDGENLSEKLKRLQEPLPEEEVMRYLPQILDALACVHQENLWHLDLKPANIMVDRTGNVTLIDFGASKQRSTTGGATTSTAVSYTNGFAPREQMEQNLEKFGPWTDLYALGATLYNLLTNKKPPLPSDIDDDRSADKHLALPMPSTVSEKTKQLILNMLTTDRLDRPQSVDKVKELMEKTPKTPNKVVEKPKIYDADEVTVVIDGTPRKTVSTPSTPKPKKSQPIKPTTEKPKPVSSGYKEPDNNNVIVDDTEEGKTNYKAIILSVLFVIGLLALLVSTKECSNLPPEAPIDENAVAEDSVIEAYANELHYTNSLGSFTYNGVVNYDNQPNGIGEAVFENGNTYEGPFVNGQMEGDNAIFKYKIGDVFEGSFKNNAFNYGKYTIAKTGEYFVGSFQNGEPLHGTWYDKAGRKLEEI